MLSVVKLVVDNGQGVHNALDLQNQSDELFGVHMNRGSIHSAMAGRRKTLFGYKIIRTSEKESVVMKPYGNCTS